MKALSAAFIAAGLAAALAGCGTAPPRPSAAASHNPHASSTSAAALPASSACTAFEALYNKMQSGWPSGNLKVADLYVHAADIRRWAAQISRLKKAPITVYAAGSDLGNVLIQVDLGVKGSPRQAGKWWDAALSMLATADNDCAS